MTALRWCGGAYLLWLAWQSARAASSGLRELESTVSVSTFQQLHRGLLLNLSNPKAPMAWVSILALGSPSAGQDVGIWLQAGMCSLLGLTIYVVYSIAFSRSPVRAAYRASRRAIEGVAAGLFAFFGLRLLLARTES
jgi:threonine/homoserine/homoserine lactone efflux protein